MLSKTALLVMGMTGSGKSSLARMIASIGGFERLSGSELLRNYALSGSPGSDEVRNAQEIGLPIVDNIVIRLYEEWIFRFTPRQVVIDGNPKDLSQGRMIFDLLTRFGFEVYGLSINIDEMDARGRVSHRKICSLCGLPSDNSNSHCLSCCGDLVIRNDDEASLFANKLHWFTQGVLPFIDYLGSKNRLLQVDGRLSSAEAAHGALATLGSLMHIKEVKNDTVCQ